VSHDLVGTLQNLVHPAVTHVSLYVVVFQVAVAAVQLQSFVADLKAVVGAYLLGEGTLRRGSRVPFVKQCRGVSKGEARDLDFPLY
jgi:hypothetical protein